MRNVIHPGFTSEGMLKIYNDFARRFRLQQPAGNFGYDNTDKTGAEELYFTAGGTRHMLRSLGGDDYIHRIMKDGGQFASPSVLNEWKRENRV